MKKIIGILLTALTLISYINVNASSTIDFNKKGTLEITLKESENDEPVSNATIKITKIADATIKDSNLSYILVDELANSNISLEDLTDTKLTTTIIAYMNNNNISLQGQTYTTNSLGKVNITDLDLGLYLINQENEVEGYSTFTPYLITIPTYDDNEWIYDLTSEPKTEILKLIDLTIKKVWVINNKNSSVPKEIQVELLLNDVAIQTITLNEDNNWEYTVKRINKSDSYSIKEINVPTGFTDTYKTENYTFTVTNTDKLPETGTLLYLVPIIATLGIAFIAAGIFINKKELTNE